MGRLSRRSNACEKPRRGTFADAGRGPKGLARVGTERGESTWRLINERVSARRYPRYGQAFKQRLGKEVQKSLATDRRWREDAEGAYV